MTWIFFAALLLLSMPQLAALALFATVPVAIVLGISAWNDYSSPVPLADALYLSWWFWGIELIGALVLVWVLLVGLSNLLSD